MRKTKRRFDLWQIQSSDYRDDMRKMNVYNGLRQTTLLATRAGGVCARPAADGALPPGCTEPPVTFGAAWPRTQPRGCLSCSRLRFVQNQILAAAPPEGSDGGLSGAVIHRIRPAGLLDHGKSQYSPPLVALPQGNHRRASRWSGALLWRRLGHRVACRQ
jgi:hypothetical protein